MKFEKIEAWQVRAGDLLVCPCSGCRCVIARAQGFPLGDWVRELPEDGVPPSSIQVDAQMASLVNRLPEASEVRKAIPLVSGLLDYFPDALAAVAYISKIGNDKHNPGQPLHWSREKSNDHADCIGRHLIDRGGFDKEGNRHSAYLAWRSLALLQEEMEKDRGLPPSRGST